MSMDYPNGYGFRLCITRSSVQVLLEHIVHDFMTEILVEGDVPGHSGISAELQEVSVVH